MRRHLPTVILALLVVQPVDAALYADGTTNQQTLDFGAQFKSRALAFKILVPGVGTGQRNTSASFINSRHAVTAAHNITDLLQYNPTYELADGLNYLTNRGNVVGVTQIIFHPTLDLAILKFAAPFPASTDKIIGTANVGDIVISAGFGRFGTPSTGLQTTRDGGLRAWDARVADTVYYHDAPYYQSTTFGFYNSGLTLNGRGASGDSGGPVYNLDDELIGISIAASTSIYEAGSTTYLALGEPTTKAWILANTTIPEQPKITVTVTPTSAELTFSNLIPTREYRVMRSSTLSAWEEAHRFTATGTSGSWSEPLAPEGRRFYRLEWDE